MEEKLNKFIRNHLIRIESNVIVEYIPSNELELGYQNIQNNYQFQEGIPSFEEYRALMTGIF